MEGVGLIGPSEGAQALRLGIESSERLPGQMVLHIALDPLDRAQLRAIRGSEESPYVLWKGEPCRGVGPPVVPQAAVPAVREGVRAGVPAPREHVGMQRGELQDEPLACRRLHRAIDIAPLADMRDRPHRLHTASREAPAAHGPSPEAAFVWAEDPDGAGSSSRG